jgi:hypothetical protein
MDWMRGEREKAIRSSGFYITLRAEITDNGWK